MKRFTFLLVAVAILGDEGAATIFVTEIPPGYHAILENEKHFQNSVESSRPLPAALQMHGRSGSSLARTRRPLPLPKSRTAATYRVREAD
jgi:hypothetical protein